MTGPEVVSRMEEMVRTRVVAGHRIGALEAEVLRCPWDGGEPLPVREVASRFGGRRDGA